MALTDKEKRMIISPQSLSINQKKNAKYLIKKKINMLFQDIQFVMDNQKILFDTFGIDVSKDAPAFEHFSESSIEKNDQSVPLYNDDEDTTNKEELSLDPGFL